MDKIMDFQGYPVYLFKGLGSPAQANIDGSIYVSPDLLNCDDKIKQYVLLHEVGHFELGHLGLYDNMPDYKRFDLEVQAGLYAIQHGADCNTVLSLLSDNIERIHSYLRECPDQLVSTVQEALSEKITRRSMVEITYSQCELCK